MGSALVVIKSVLRTQRQTIVRIERRGRISFTLLKLVCLDLPSPANFVHHQSLVLDRVGNLKSTGCFLLSLTRGICPRKKKLLCHLDHGFAVGRSGVRLQIRKYSTALFVFIRESVPDHHVLAGVLGLRVENCWLQSGTLEIAVFA